MLQTDNAVADTLNRLTKVMRMFGQDNGESASAMTRFCQVAQTARIDLTSLCVVQGESSGRSAQYLEAVIEKLSRDLNRVAATSRICYAQLEEFRDDNRKLREKLENARVRYTYAEEKLQAVIAPRGRPTVAHLSSEVIRLRNELTAERIALDAMRAERDAAIAERDAMIAERDAAIAGRNEIDDYYHDMVAERDQAEAQRDAAFAERDAAVAAAEAAKVAPAGVSPEPAPVEPVASAVEGELADLREAVKRCRDPRYQTVADWLAHNPSMRITTREIVTGAFGEDAQQDAATHRRVARIMREIGGWKASTNIRCGSCRVRGYIHSS